MNTIRRTCVLLALAAAVVSAGATVPLHELEALAGHESHGSADGAPAVSHSCHDEDECQTCRLLSLPHFSADAAPPDLACGEVSWSVSSPAADVRDAGKSSPFSARAPPG
ncbi:MAG: hypothetical protein HYY18_21830 [Planctomycetes bacterium]|nr:hypothetical protein [Planctomycetota bacterium]